MPELGAVLGLEPDIGLPAVLGVPEVGVEVRLWMTLIGGVGAGMELAIGLAPEILLWAISSGSALEAVWRTVSSSAFLIAVSEGASRNGAGWRSPGPSRMSK